LQNYATFCKVSPLKIQQEIAMAEKRISTHSQNKNRGPIKKEKKLKNSS